jgi:hypothetical protein
VGSIPDEVIGFFNWPNSSSCTVALGSTPPLTEMSARDPPGGKGQSMRKADTTLPFVSCLSRKCRSRDISQGLYSQLQGQLYLPLFLFLQL